MLLVVQASSPQWLVISAKYLHLGSHAVASARVKQSQVSDTGDDMHLKAKNVELTAVSVIFCKAPVGGDESDHSRGGVDGKQ